MAVSCYEHFLPHPHPEIHGHHRRAKLLNSPALASYLLFLFTFLLTSSLVRAKLPGVLGYATNISFDALISDTNQERQTHNVGVLKVNEQLNKAAAAKAAYMFKYNFWAHVAPDGTTPWYFFTNAGYEYRYAGENLARDFNDSEAVVTAWMNSPSHRENLLNPNYTDIGFAVVNGVLDGYETTLVVQMFGRPLSTNTAAVVPPEAVKTEKVAPVEVVAEKLTVEPLPSIPVKAEPAGKILPAVDVATASRAITVTLGLFLSLLFAVDGYYTWRRHLLRLSGSTVAHLGLLALALIGIWYTNVGVII